MRLVIDTSVLIDVLRGRSEARRSLETAIRAGHELWSSHVVLAEVLVGMRPGEETATRRLLSQLTWVPVDEGLAESAGDLGRRYLPAHRGIEISDLLVAALAQQLDAELRTTNVKDYPMFPRLRAAY